MISKQLLSAQKEIRSKYKTVEEEDEDLGMEAYDDVTGAQLIPAKVQQAMKEEVEYVRKMHVYDTVTIKECQQQNGQKSNISALD